MFEGIVAARGPCDHCTKTRVLAYISRSSEDEPYGVARSEDPLRLCAGCIYKLTRLAGLLLKLEAPPARKVARKPARAAKPLPREPVPTPMPSSGLYQP